MIRVRPLAQLLASPERAHETPGGDQFLVNNMEQQATLEVEPLRRRKRAEIESLRRQKRAEKQRARRKLVDTFPRTEVRPNRAKRPRREELREGDKVVCLPDSTKLKMTLEEFVEFITSSPTYDEMDLGPVPDIIMENPEDDVFLEHSQRGDIPLAPYSWRLKILKMRHYVTTHHRECDLRIGRLFVENGRIEVLLTPQVG